MPLFLVVLVKNTVNRGIYNITNISCFRVKVEPLKKSTMPPQCYRCQEFFHHSRLCNRTPKCVKCGGSHLTRVCTKSAKTPAKCALCGGPHPANYSGCPRNPIHKQPTPKQQVDKNVWVERKKAPQNNTPQNNTPHQLYSSAVKKPMGNMTLDATVIIQQMAQMMQQWGSMLTALQNSIN